MLDATSHFILTARCNLVRNLSYIHECTSQKPIPFIIRQVDENYTQLPSFITLCPKLVLTILRTPHAHLPASYHTYDLVTS